MPSARHEAIANMLREHPEVVLTILRAIHPRLPARATARNETAAISGLVPDFRADSVVGVFAGKHLNCVVICEVQLTHDADKLFSLPAYQALARHQHRVPCEVIVVAPVEKVARRLRKPIALGGESIFKATVIGQAELLQIQSPPVEIEFLRAFGTKDPKLVLKLTGRLLAERPAHAQLYYDVILASLSEATRALVESMMSSNYEYQSAFAKKYVEEGREEGRVEGAVEALQNAIRTVLSTRSISLSSQSVQMLDACRDLEQLDRWLSRAVMAASDADVFAAD